jgi:hypothetical protein
MAAAEHAGGRAVERGHWPVWTAGIAVETYQGV